MHLDGTLEIAAPRERVWEALIDPRAVSACISGAGQVAIKVVDETHIQVAGRVGTGFIKLPAYAELTFTTRDAPEQARVAIHGQAAGNTLEATATLELRAIDGASTAVRWSADTSLRGPMASMGEGMIRRSGAGAVDRVLACMKARLEA